MYMYMYMYVCHVSKVTFVPSEFTVGTVQYWVIDLFSIDSLKTSLFLSTCDTKILIQNNYLLKKSKGSDSMVILRLLTLSGSSTFPQYPDSICTNVQLTFFIHTIFFHRRLYKYFQTLQMESRE